MPSYSYHLRKSLFLLQSHSLVGGESFVGWKIYLKSGSCCLYYTMSRVVFVATRITNDPKDAYHLTSPKMLADVHRFSISYFYLFQSFYEDIITHVCHRACLGHHIYI